MQLEKELQTGIEDGIAKAYNGSNTDTVTLNALNKLQETVRVCVFNCRCHGDFGIKSFVQLELFEYASNSFLSVVSRKVEIASV